MYILGYLTSLTALRKSVSLITATLVMTLLTSPSNVQLYKALKDQLSDVCEELKRISAGQSPDPELLEVLRLTIGLVKNIVIVLLIEGIILAFLLLIGVHG